MAAPVVRVPADISVRLRIVLSFLSSYFTSYYNAFVYVSCHLLTAASRVAAFVCLYVACFC